MVAALLSAAMCIGAAGTLGTTRAAAATSLRQTWATTVHVGPSSGPRPTVSGETVGGATIAHLFGVRRTQVVVGFQDGSVSVLDGRTGAELPGWPRYTGGPIHSNPSIADLNNDGREEVAVTSESGWVNVWNPDGSEFPGWPPAQHASGDGRAARILWRRGNRRPVRRWKQGACGGGVGSPRVCVEQERTHAQWLPDPLVGHHLGHPCARRPAEQAAARRGRGLRRLRTARLPEGRHRMAFRHRGARSTSNRTSRAASYRAGRI